jgi:hypothetical protein
MAAVAILNFDFYFRFPKFEVYDHEGHVSCKFHSLPWIGSKVLAVCPFATLLWEFPITAKKLCVLGGFDPQDPRQYYSDPQKALSSAKPRLLSY